MRVLFFHLGTMPSVSPDLPDTDAIEAWAQRMYGYRMDEDAEGWRSISVEDWEECPPLPGSSGDTDLDWPIRRTLCDEDWYAGPIEVLS
jgi:hypothetical protein